jgi:hypothetical protein
MNPYYRKETKLQTIPVNQDNERDFSKLYEENYEDCETL